MHLNIPPSTTFIINYYHRVKHLSPTVSRRSNNAASRAPSNAAARSFWRSHWPRSWFRRRALPPNSRLKKIVWISPHGLLFQFERSPSREQFLEYLIFIFYYYYFSPPNLFSTFFTVNILLIIVCFRERPPPLPPYSYTNPSKRAKILSPSALPSTIVLRLIVWALRRKPWASRMRPKHDPMHWMCSS